MNDNFFDLGGHSLKATILMSKIHKELNREVPLKELFKSPTIK
ncbi:phosphopantetheine-binding protein, partial [Clostridium botulinum]|nr:phosphopantetheine-binding protein [Clostridium botulinum]